MSDSTEMRPAASPGTNRMLLRLLHLVLMALLIGAAMTAMHVLTVLQFIHMLVDKGRPNPRIADFGKRLGRWLARAVRFQLAETDDKPWPWSQAD